MTQPQNGGTLPLEMPLTRGKLPTLIAAPFPMNCSRTPCQPRKRASVTTNDGIPTLATRKPVSVPIAIPVAIAA